LEGTGGATVPVRDVLRAVAASGARAAAQAAPAAALPAADTALRFSQLLVGRRRQHRLELRFARGSLTQVDSRAYVLGIYRNVAPGGAARAIDLRLNGAITEFTARRMFSGGVGEIFALPVGRNTLRADMVVFAGLGSFDTYTPETQQMVAENIIRVLIRTRVEEFATVLVGGGTGYSVRTLLENLLRGFFRGLKDADPEARFRAITLCETDSARMAEIKSKVYALSSTDLFADTEILLDEIELEPKVEPTRDRGMRTAPEPVYLLFRAEKASRDRLVLRSSVLSASARATLVTDRVEVPEKQLAKLLDDLNPVVDPGSPAAMNEFGERLAAEVLPPAVRSELLHSRGHHLVVVHDAIGSRIPWETIRLTDGRAAGDAWAPARDAGLSHRLHADNLPLANWLEHRRTEAGINVLLIVDPRRDLPGAREEGERVAALASRTPGLNLKAINGRDASLAAVLKELRSGAYDLVHYAGHAFFDPDRPADSGLILSDNVLRGADLDKTFNLPSLVFFNACESARVRRGVPGAVPEVSRRRAGQQVSRSFGIAETILRAGIANVLGTYWPVQDRAATDFSAQFYQALLRGAAIGDAIQSGRKAVADLGSIDWADYVFYGSHDFSLKLVPPDTAQP
jgi:hypothetical protein